MKLLEQAQDKIIKAPRFAYCEAFDIPDEIENSLGDLFEKKQIYVESFHEKR